MIQDNSTDTKACFSAIPSLSTSVSTSILRDDQNRRIFLQNLFTNDTIDVSDGTLIQINHDMKEKIISKYHKNAITLIKEGRFKGYRQTYFGNGHKRLQKRFKTLEELYNFVLQYYAVDALTVEQYFPHWLDWKCAKNNNKKSTKENNQNAYNKFVRGTKLEKMALSKITTQVLEDWCCETLIQHPMNARRWNTYKIVIMGLFPLAIKERLIQDNPWKKELIDYHMLLKAVRRAPSKNKIFYPDEVETLMKKFISGYRMNRNSANIALAIDMDLGLRVGELAALKWSDVDWKGKTIFIQRQESEKVIENYVKSDSSEGYRELPLNNQIINLLMMLKGDFGFNSDFIFTDASGKRKTTKSMQARLIHIQDELNRRNGTQNRIKRIHCIRRTVGTRIANDKGLEAARQWLGHTDIQTTLRYIYTMETTESMRSYIESKSTIPSADDLKYEKFSSRQALKNVEIISSAKVV